MNSPYWLTNVRLESGYRYEEGLVAGTETEICHLLIEDGKISEIMSAVTTIDSDLPKQDARNLLALPSFTEKHFHLDKTYLGGPWKASKPAKNLIERLEWEANELPALSKTTRERAEQLLDLILQSGSTHIRTHVNIDPYIGLKNLEAIRMALESFKGKLSYEIVAFPQHGLLRTQVGDLMRQALREGATLVGGVDPAGVDGNVEASLQQMMEIAVEANADIDLHLHDSDYLGAYTMNRLAGLTEEASWQGRVAVSHAFGLGGVPIEQAEEMADVFAALGITVISAVPIRFDVHIPPIPMLQKKGVEVAIGCDSMFDCWAPFGNADILERASRLAERFRWLDECSLAQSLGFITGGKTPLNQEGKRLWPKLGDEANIVFAKAGCSAEAVARKAKRSAVMFRGKLVSGTLEPVEDRPFS